MSDKNQQQQPQQSDRYDTLSRVDFYEYVPGLTTYQQVGGTGPTPNLKQLRADYRNQVIEVVNEIGPVQKVPMGMVKKLTIMADK